MKSVAVFNQQSLHGRQFKTAVVTAVPLVATDLNTVCSVTTSGLTEGTLANRALTRTAVQTLVDCIGNSKELVGHLDETADLD